MKPKFFILDEVPDFFIDDLKGLGYEVAYCPNAETNNLPEGLEKAYGLVVRSKTPVCKILLDQMPALKFILRPGSGTDNIDKKEAQKRNITTINSPEGNRDAVGEHVIGMLLSLMNNIVPASNALKNYRWERKANRGVELKGKTIGIIGYGNTGSSVAKRLQGFEMQILAYDAWKSGFEEEGVKEVELAEIRDKADIVTLHIPLNSQNYHFVNGRFLNSFRKPVYIINASRGPILDTSALVKAIRNGHALGACLDVLENEELETYQSEEKAQLNELLNNGNVLITPHIAGWSYESMERNYTVLISKLKAHHD